MAIRARIQRIRGFNIGGMLSAWTGQRAVYACCCAGAEGLVDLEAQSHRKFS